MSVSDSQNYKEVVQLALRTEKLTRERRSRGNFQKRKGFEFTLGQSSKKSRSPDSSENSSGSGTDSVSSPQFTRTPQPSKLGTSLQGSASKGRATSDKCPRCRQFHTGACGAPQLCF